MKLSFSQGQKELWLWRFTTYTKETRGFSSIKKLGLSASPSRHYFEITVGWFRASLLTASKMSKEDAMQAQHLWYLEAQHLLPISPNLQHQRDFLGYRSLNQWHFKRNQFPELLNLLPSPPFFQLGGHSSSLFQNWCSQWEFSSDITFRSSFTFFFFLSSHNCTYKSHSISSKTTTVCGTALSFGYSKTTLK